MALQVRTGSVHINGGMGKMGFGPLGGYERSGIGREYGPGWLKEFTQEKAIFYRSADDRRTAHSPLAGAGRAE